LPTYPFEGERFWIDPGDFSGVATALGGAGAKRQEIDDWFYLPCWKPSLPPELDGDPAAPGSRWLVFLDGDGLGRRLAERLEETGRSVTRVEAGERFARLGDRSYAVAPGRREDHDALLKELVAGGEVPEVVLHLWNVGRERDGDAMQAALADEARGFWSLLYLAQACGKQNLTTPLRLAVVSNNLQRVAGEDVLCPGKATLLGPSRIIPLEYPHIRCASVDVLLPAPGSPAELELIERLLAEAAGGLPDPIVAYRGHGRFLLGYESVRVGPAPP